MTSSRLNTRSARRPHRSTSVRRRGVTLLELALAIGLMVLLCTMMFVFYETMLKARDHGTRSIVDRQLARTIAMKVADEVRSANGFLPGVGPGITGDGRMIILQTVVLPDKEQFVNHRIQDQLPPAQSDIRQVMYYLSYDQDQTYSYPDGTDNFAPLGLVRREIKTLNQVVIDETQKEDVDVDLLAPEIRYLRFRYFDGVEWIDKWDIGRGPEGSLGNSLPQAVEITVGYTAMPPPPEDQGELDLSNEDLLPSPPEPYSAETYSIMVRLPQADTFFGSRLMRASRKASSSSSGEGGT